MRTLAFVLLASSLATHALAQNAHWKLDEKSGTTAADSSANQNDGTLKNFPTTTSPWVAGKFGNALTFDGADDYVEVRPKKGLPIYDGKGSPYSVAFWVKGGKQEDRRVYAEASTRNNQPLFTIGTGRVSLNTGDRLHVFVRNDAGRVVVNHSSNGVVFDGKWHHVAWVDVAGQGTLYIDGVKDTKNFDYTSTNAAGGRGTRTRGYGTYSMDVAALGAVLRGTACCQFKGEIDDLRVYRFALTPADLKILIATAAPNFPPCNASIGKFGYGCGGTLDLVATGSAAYGKTLGLQLTKGTPNATAILLVGLPVAPLDLGLAGFSGCVLYPSLAGSIQVGIGKLDSTGASTTINVTMPTSTALACVIGAVQGAAISGTKLELSGVVLAQLGR